MSNSNKYINQNRLVFEMTGLQFRMICSTQLTPFSLPFFRNFSSFVSRSVPCALTTWASASSVNTTTWTIIEMNINIKEFLASDPLWIHGWIIFIFIVASIRLNKKPNGIKRKNSLIIPCKVTVLDDKIQQNNHNKYLLLSAFQCDHFFPL